MTQHLHSERVPGCFRCDLSAGEVPGPAERVPLTDEQQLARMERALDAIAAELRASRAREVELVAELAGLRESSHIGMELDNHHNANLCPYCHAPLLAARAREQELQQRPDGAPEVPMPYRNGGCRRV